MEFAWLLLLLPLLSAAAIQLGLKKVASLSAWLATGSAGATLLISLGLLGQEGSVAFSWANCNSVLIHVFF